MISENQPAIMPALRLMPVAQQDCADLWQWRNDPDTRAMSLTTDMVSYDEHCCWFDLMLEDPSQYLYIATLKDFTNNHAVNKVGMVRFEMHSNQANNNVGKVKKSDKSAVVIATISINLNPQYRGKGLSVPMLKQAVKIFTIATSAAGLVPARTSVSYIKAVIKSSNIASIKCFTGAGFINANDLISGPSKTEKVYQDCMFLFALW
jgi:hypothetical protein